MLTRAVLNPNRRPSRVFAIVVLAIVALLVTNKEAPSSGDDVQAGTSVASYTSTHFAGGVITPPALAGGTVNDYGPPGLSNAWVIDQYADCEKIVMDGHSRMVDDVPVQRELGSDRCRHARVQSPQLSADSRHASSRPSQFAVRELLTEDHAALAVDVALLIALRAETSRMIDDPGRVWCAAKLAPGVAAA